MISNQETLNLSPYMAIYEVRVKVKNGHRYDTASTAGLFGMKIQGATTIFAVNLKRILKLLNENK